MNVLFATACVCAAYGPLQQLYDKLGGREVEHLAEECAGGQAVLVVHVEYCSVPLNINPASQRRQSAAERDRRGRADQRYDSDAELEEGPEEAGEVAGGHTGSSAPEDGYTEEYEEGIGKRVTGTDVGKPCKFWAALLIAIALQMAARV